ncbi:FapA family protein [Treponema sp.]|uniref:FapA family protein n=1 Tax=Treponema sp. TaxID=166 RepID=UPI003EFEBFEE
MVTLDKLRLEMEKQLAFDKNIHTVEVRADTLDECLDDASVQLGSKKNNLEYEVIEKGCQGIAGLMKKPWRIRVYENPSIIRKKKAMEAASLGGTQSDTGVLENEKVDGMFYVHRFGSHIFVKVTLPKGNGSPIEASDLLNEARRPDNISLDEKLLKKLASEGTEDKYVDVGQFTHVPACDAVMAVDISKDEMQVTITVSPPSSGGSEISAENIKSALKTQGVCAGIDEEKINSFVDTPVYNIPYLVAAAVLPVNGTDAYIEYNFKTDKTKLRLKETANGQVDFKELNLIENVVAGQPLAKKILPQRGKVGKTVFGRCLEAKNGKDIPIPLGQNTRLDKDGRTIVAEKNGNVILVGDKITVEEVYEVPGVNIKSGNIRYMGTVVCRGNVEDGFNIKADGNIEIYGSVGNCRIEAGGDIVISQGVMGRDEGEIITSKSVWARFLQNVKVTAEEYVVVNDNIMNSNVTAMKKILLKGKRASIIGGHLFATEEITAKNIGSSGGGIETILEVGFDPKAKLRLQELQELQSNVVKQLEEVDLNISTLENQKKVRRSLPKEKEETLANLRTQRVELMDSSEKMSAEINEINAHNRELKVVGCVNASGTVYPGAKILVRDEIDEVRSECKAVTFYFDSGFVKRKKYEPAQDAEEVEKPDGFK